MILWDLCSLRFFCCSSLKIKSYWSSLLPWTLILIFVQAFSPRLSCLLHLYLQNPFCFALRNSVFWPMNSTFQRPHWLFSCFPYYNLSLYLMCFLLSLGEVGTASFPAPSGVGAGVADIFPVSQWYFSTVLCLTKALTLWGSGHPILILLVLIVLVFYQTFKHYWRFCHLNHSFPPQCLPLFSVISKIYADVRDWVGPSTGK